MTRQDLYDLVWNEPMTHAAKRFRISDVALRKVCVKHDIPTPPLGYWAKLAYGKPVTKPALPPTSGGIGVQINLSAKDADAVPTVVIAAMAEADAQEDLPGNHIEVLTDQPKGLHGATSAIERQLKAAKVDHDGFLRIGNSYYRSVSIGKASLGRTILFIETIVRAFKARGYLITSGEDGVLLARDEETFLFRVYETKSRTPYVPTPTDIRRQAQYDDDGRRMPSVYPPMKVTPAWSHYPSGRLCFEISDQSKYRWNSEHIIGRWYDRSNKKIEDQIRASIVAMAGAAANNKVLRAEEREKERVRLEQEALRLREQAERERKQRQKVYLNRKARELERLRRLETLERAISGTDDRRDYPELSVMHTILQELIADRQRAFSAASLNEEIRAMDILTLKDSRLGTVD